MKPAQWRFELILTACLAASALLYLVRSPSGKLTAMLHKGPSASESAEIRFRGAVCDLGVCSEQFEVENKLPRAVTVTIRAIDLPGQTPKDHFPLPPIHLKPREMKVVASAFTEGDPKAPVDWRRRTVEFTTDAR